MAQRCNARFLSQRPYVCQKASFASTRCACPIYVWHICCRRRMMRNLAFEHHVCVAVVEEVPGLVEGGAIEVNSPQPYGV